MSESEKNMMIDLESRVSDLEGIKNPLTTEGRIETIFSQIDELTQKIVVLTKRMSDYIFDYSHVETFSDDKLRELYENGGITIGELKTFIEKNFTDGKSVSLETASNYANGEIKDLKIRSALGKYFRQNIK